MNQNQKYQTMTEGVIWKQILFFSIPMVISNILQQFYSLFDSLFVGKFVGEIGLAAVGSTGSLIYLLVGFFLGLSAGAGVVISNYYGAGKYDDLKKAVHTSIILSVVGGIALTVLGWVFTPLLLRFMNMPDLVFDAAVDYLRIYFLGMVPMLVYNVAAGILRAIGDSNRPMLILFFCGVLHVALNYVFILLWNMGVVGAAVSTGISQLVSAIWVMLLFVRTQGVEKITWKEMRVDWQILRHVLGIGIPAGFQTSLYSIANILIQANINKFGAIAMAGTAVYYRIDGLLYAPMVAVGVAVMTFVGQNIGARKYDRIRQGIRDALWITVPNSLVMALFTIVFREQVLGVFTDSAEVLENAILVMFFMTPVFWIQSITEVISGAIRGTGNSLTPMLITLFCICVFRISWILIVTQFWADFRAVIMSFPLFWVICMVIFLIYFRRNTSRFFAKI